MAAESRECLTTTVDDGVADVVIDNPPVNLLTPALFGALSRLADEGITWATIGFPAKERRTYIDALRRYADRLR